VSLATTGGRSFTIKVTAQKGSPGNPMSRGEHRDKFRAGAESSLGLDQAAVLERRIDGIWSAPDIDGLVSLLATNGSRPVVRRAEHDGSQEVFGT
jgi:hypothetical protein